MPYEELQYAPPRLPFCAGTSMRFSSTIVVNSPAIVGENLLYPSRTISTASSHVYVSELEPMSMLALRSLHVNVSRPWVLLRTAFFRR